MTTHAIPPLTQLLPGDQLLEALDHARALAGAGVRLFLAQPARTPDGGWDPTGGTGKSGYHLPAWQRAARADPDIVGRWRVGMALCAVMDGPVNAVDVDPGNGGDQSAAQLRAEGAWPRSYGRQATPSGGTHDLVAPLGVHSRDATMPGVDVKAGDETGGAGFIFLCPTVKVSKATGRVEPYRWVNPPDVDALREWADADDSGLPLAARIHALRAPAAATPAGQPGDAYQALDEAARGRVDRYLDGVVASTRVELAGAAGMREGETDDRGRGWQKIVADACNRYGRLARADWTPWDAAAAWQQLEAVVPAAITSQVDVRLAWREQHGRRPAAGWPAALDEPAGGLTFNGSAPGASQPAPALQGALRALTAPPLDAAGQDEDGGDGDGQASWAAIDLGPYLDGTFRPAVASLMPRSDGVCLLYPGMIHSFHGESESGKSLVLQIEAARLVKAGRPVLYLDFESDPASIAQRMTKVLGCTPAELAAHFTYTNPETHPLSSPAETEAWYGMLGSVYDLAVVDGVTDSLGIFSASTKDNDDIAAWMRTLPRNIAKRTGAAVVLIDHVTKDTETRGRYAVGGQAKMNAITGSAFTVEVVEPLGDMLKGVVVLRVGKDRPGTIRANAGPMRKSDRTQEVARVIVDSTGDVTTSQVVPWVDADGENGAGARMTGLMEKISRYIEQCDAPPSTRAIREHVGGKSDRVQKALETLASEGFTTVTEGPRRSTVHALTATYRQSTDPRADTFQGPALTLVGAPNQSSGSLVPYGSPVVPGTTGLSGSLVPYPEGGGTWGTTTRIDKNQSSGSHTLEDVDCRSCGTTGATTIYGPWQCSHCNGRIDGKPWT